MVIREKPIIREKIYIFLFSGKWDKDKPGGRLILCHVSVRLLIFSSHKRVSIFLDPGLQSGRVL